MIERGVGFASTPRPQTFDENAHAVIGGGRFVITF